MKLEQILFSLLIIWTSGSCTIDKLDSNRKNELTPSLGSNKEIDTFLKEVKINNSSLPSIKQIKLSDIKLKSIKKTFFDDNYYTSGVLSKKASSFFEHLNEDYFYGFYSFIEKEEDTKPLFPYIAKAIVKVQNKKNWDYNNSDEELIEFTFLSNKYNPFIDLVEIGQTKNDLIKKFGKDFKKEKSNFIYFYEDNYVVSFLMKNDSIVGVRVGLYKNQNNFPLLIPY